MPKSQSLLLAAILLGAQKPNPPRVLRSSLYGILDDQDCVAAGAIESGKVSLFAVPQEVEAITASVVGLDFIELRTTQIKYIDEESISADVIGTDSISLRSTLVKGSDEEAITASHVNVDNISLARVLVKYDDQEVHQVNASVIGIESITLVKP